MKFLYKDSFFKKKNNITLYSNYTLLENFENKSKFFKFFVLKDKKYYRKVFLKTRKGLSLNEKKNSIIRDFNYDTLQKLINIMTKKGKKNTTFEHINKAIEHFFFSFNEFNYDFGNYDNYKNLMFLMNNLHEYNNFNYLFNLSLKRHISIFDLKPKKIDKKKKKQTNSYEITYIPPKRRLKNLLKIISFYSENFKNYSFWERLFWLFFSIIVNKKPFYISKRRNYIYKKAIRQFILKN